MNTDVAPGVKFRKLYIIALVLPAALLAGVCLMIPNILQRDLLPRLIAPQAAEYQVVQANNDKSLFSSDPTYVWMVDFPSKPILIPLDYVKSDNSDLEFAVNEIGNLLNAKIDQRSRLEVFRTVRVDMKIYLVANPERNRIWIMAFPR